MKAAVKLRVLSSNTTLPSLMGNSSCKVRYLLRCCNFLTAIILYINIAPLNSSRAFLCVVLIVKSYNRVTAQTFFNHNSPRSFFNI